eukprot:tig00000459_g1065.t1
MASCTLYECLEVARDADLSQIRAAYRRLSLLHHPDRNPGDASATARFQRLAEAYETLSDGEKPIFSLKKRHRHPDAAPDRRRAEYDRRLAIDEADAHSGARRSAYASPYGPSGRAGADAFARAQAIFDAFFAQADFLFGMMDLQSQMLLGGGLAHRARRAPAGAPLHPFASPFGFAMGPLAAGGTATWQPFGLAADPFSSTSPYLGPFGAGAPGPQQQQPSRPQQPQAGTQPQGRFRIPVRVVNSSASASSAAGLGAAPTFSARGQHAPAAPAATRPPHAYGQRRPPAREPSPRDSPPPGTAAEFDRPAARRARRSAGPRRAASPQEPPPPGTEVIDLDSD